MKNFGERWKKKLKLLIGAENFGGRNLNLRFLVRFLLKRTCEVKLI